MRTRVCDAPQATLLMLDLAGSCYTSFTSSV
jgi:hypothetical protein